MNPLLRCFPMLLLILICRPAFAQNIPKEILLDSIKNKAAITAGRNQLLLMIGREQKKADVSDGVIDKRLDIDGDVIKSDAITKALFQKVNRTVAYIENNETDDMVKRKLLGRVIENLKIFNTDMNDGYCDIPYYVTLFEQSYQVIRGIHNKNLALYVKDNISKMMYMLSPLFDTDTAAMNVLLAGISDRYPELLVRKLRTIKVPSAADIVVAKAAPRSPKLILNYATSTAVERDIVRRNTNPYVQAIVKIADSCQVPLKGIFFIDEYIQGHLDMSTLNSICNEEETYFKRMVSLPTTHFAGDMRTSYHREMVHIVSQYVNSMNELHEASDAVRFRCIEKLSATELYYVMVFGSDDLYTSSFLGCFNRLLNRFKPKSGDQFLQELNQYKFRTFIRLCANYNTLGSFLNTMKGEQRIGLMRSFVHGLDSTAEQDLEGATDVANSFASINDSSLMAHITEEIRNSRLTDSVNRNLRGYKIYDILYHMLTASPDSLSRRYNIPPISVMPISQLGNDSGVVIQQVMFYGDEDGKGVFNSYLNSFPPSEWKIQREEKWVVISSTKGKPVVIYANKPLDEPEDELAQNALQEYLDSNDIRPTVMIHRGHSYHLSGTLEHLNYRHKVVILGACGAYQNLSSVLSASEDAQIVSTKQIGTGNINSRIIKLFNQRLVEGRDIDWVELWAQLSKQFASGDMKERFDDYVPPYKNLGALFLKAYRRMEVDY
ncbi:MAG TPA: hypothetical protein PLP34_01320 [Chitinophagaceae bacterium]|nr:hypothetical protein [Chitinophagaceae bacterium]HNF71017.1 hypothetical protein [Chitinophagaceae bacterium]